jgi:hypothetical protein
MEIGMIMKLSAMQRVNGVPDNTLCGRFQGLLSYLQSTSEFLCDGLWRHPQMPVFGAHLCNRYIISTSSCNVVNSGYHAVNHLNEAIDRKWQVQELSD